MSFEQSSSSSDDESSHDASSHEDTEHEKTIKEESQGDESKPPESDIEDEAICRRALENFLRSHSPFPLPLPLGDESISGETEEVSTNAHQHRVTPSILSLLRSQSSSAHKPTSVSSSISHKSSTESSTSSDDEHSEKEEKEDKEDKEDQEDQERIKETEEGSDVLNREDPVVQELVDCVLSSLHSDLHKDGQSFSSLAGSLVHRLVDGILSELGDDLSDDVRPGLRSLSESVINESVSTSLSHLDERELESVISSTLAQSISSALQNLDNDSSSSARSRAEALIGCLSLSTISKLSSVSEATSNAEDPKSRPETEEEILVRLLSEELSKRTEDVLSELVKLHPVSETSSSEDESTEENHSSDKECSKSSPHSTFIDSFLSDIRQELLADPEISSDSVCSNSSRLLTSLLCQAKEEIVHSRPSQREGEDKEDKEHSVSSSDDEDSNVHEIECFSSLSPKEQQSVIEKAIQNFFAAHSEDTQVSEDVIRSVNEDLIISPHESDDETLQSAQSTIKTHVINSVKNCISHNHPESLHSLAPLAVKVVDDIVRDLVDRVYNDSSHISTRLLQDLLSSIIRDIDEREFQSIVDQTTKEVI